MKHIESQPIFIPGEQPFAQCHASTLVETAGGRLMAAWFGGTREGDPDVAIWTAEWSGGPWSRPVKAVDVPGVPLWNPVLFRDASGSIWLFYKVGYTIPAWTGAYLRSMDGGRTWSSPVYLPAGLLGPAKNKPVLLSNGEILCGSSAETWQSWACWVEVIAEGGERWQRFGPIRAPVIAPEPKEGEKNAWDGFAGVIQPALWEYAPGKVKMLMRATRPVGYLCESTSEDYGRTWSPAAQTSLPCPNSGIDAALLADGRVALAYNASKSERTPLVVAISGDNGATWPVRYLVETEPGEFSYPAIIQASDGMIHLIYTHNRAAIYHAAVPAGVAACAAAP